MDYLLVHRGAQYTGVAAISFKCGGGAKLSHLLLRRVFQVEGSDAGLDERSYVLEDLTNYRSAAPHFFYFLRRLNHDGHRPCFNSLF